MRALPEDFDWRSYAKTNIIPELDKFNLDMLTLHKEQVVERIVKYHYMTHEDVQIDKKVLIITPAYNSELTIEESIMSVKNQTYTNITHVVVDDCSTDRTAEIVQSIETIHYHRLERNMGTYAAINYALNLYQDFDYFMIHDADDVMYVNNVEEHLRHFTNNILAVSTGFNRVNYNTKEIVSTSSMGSTTTMYSKAVFNKLGYYDNTRFGGDSEYTERFNMCYGTYPLITNLILTDAYYVPNNSNLTKTIGGNIRNKYIKDFKKKHLEMKKNNNFYVPYKDMLISVNLASYPGRKKSLIKVLNNLLTIKSINIIRVYLNNYDTIPEELPQDSRILYYIGEVDLKDTGKFYWSGSFKNEYYFTCDDDFIYNEDYFNKSVSKLREYNGEVIVSIHGKILVPQPRVFNDVSRNIRCIESNSKDEWVNQPGTGAMVFDNSRYIIPLDLFKSNGLTDMWVSLFAQKFKIPILCREHKSGEMVYIDQGKDTLFDKRFELDKLHQEVLKSVDEWVVYKK